MELGTARSVSVSAGSRELDRLLVTTVVVAGVCLFVVAGSAQLGRQHSGDAPGGAAGIRLYSTVMSQVLGRRGSSCATGTCAAAVSVPKVCALWLNHGAGTGFVLQNLF